MKSFLVVAAAATSANALLDNLLGVAGNGDSSMGDIASDNQGGANLVDFGNNVNGFFPHGIAFPQDCFQCTPTAPPPADRTNVYHPAHPGVDIDGCDDDGEHGWHWVHPGHGHEGQAPHSWATSTVVKTAVHTVIACESTVVNCPAHSTVLTTVTVPAATTICPVPVATSTRHISKPAKTTVVPVAPVTTVVETPCPEETVSEKPSSPVYWTVPEQPSAPAYTAPQQPSAPVYNSPSAPPAAPAPPAATNTPPPAGTPVPVPPPAGAPPAPPAVPTGVTPGNNMTSPPVIGAAPQVQAIGATLVAGLLAAIAI